MQLAAAGSSGVFVVVVVADVVGNNDKEHTTQDTSVDVSMKCYCARRIRALEAFSEALRVFAQLPNAHKQKRRRLFSHVFACVISAALVSS